MLRLLPPESASIHNEFYPDDYRPTDLGELLFVFGSNQAGIHGAGAAETAMNKYGAVYGVGDGITGQCYAIATKDHHIRTLPIELIKPAVDRFRDLTRRGEHGFFVTAVGCGLAGYTASDIAPLFKGCWYCYFPESWMPYVLN